MRPVYIPGFRGVKRIRVTDSTGIGRRLTSSVCSYPISAVWTTEAIYKVPCLRV